MNQALNHVVAKAKAANSPKWVRAIERAAEGLVSGELVVTLLSGYALVTSSNGSYRVNGFCGCEAARRGHRECKHRAAVRLTEMLETAPVVSRLALIADIKAAWSRRFPGVSLADELLRRFRVNTLDYLAEDMLRGVLAVCV